MHTPAECRQNAADCVEFAARTKNADQRNFFLGLAENWQQLARAAQQENDLKNDDTAE